MSERVESQTDTAQCDHCGHEGEPDSADYYGAEIAVCEECGCEL